MELAHFVAVDLFKLGVGEGQGRLARLQHLHLGAGVLIEMHGVHQQGG